jgi:hypothetical protein
MPERNQQANAPSESPPANTGGSNTGSSGTNGGIVEMRVVSGNARVRETEIILSETASRRLQTRGRIPPR